MGKRLLVLILFVLSDPAQADISLTVSAGINEASQRGDGNWRQRHNPTFQTQDLTDKTWSIGLTGTTSVPWLNWSIAYHDLGKFTAFGEFTKTDEQYFSRNFLNQSISDVTSEVRGFTFTLDPQLCKGDWCAFSKLGVFYFRNRVVVFNNGSRTDGVPQENVFPLRRLFTERTDDLTAYGALGVSYRDVFLQYSLDGGGHNSQSVGKHNESIVLGYKFDL